MDSPFPRPLRRPAPTAGGEVDDPTSSLFISAAGQVVAPTSRTATLSDA